MFKVGDKVWSDEFGVGEVTTCDADPMYPVEVDFEAEKGLPYTSEGAWSRYGPHDFDIIPYTGQDNEARQ